MVKVLKVIYKFLLKKKYWLLLYWVLIIASPVVSSIAPYFYKLFVDGLTSLTYDALTSILFIFIAVKFLDIALHASSYLVSDILSLDTLPAIYSTIFKHVHLLDFAYHTKKSSGSLISTFKRGEGGFWNLYHSLHHRVVDAFDQYRFT